MGAFLRRRAGTDMESYFLAGRRMPGWLNGCSYAATCLNADVAPAYTGMTVITGTFICWWYLSRFGLALMIGAVLFAVFWRRLALMTSPEFYELRFGGRAALTVRTWVALRSAFIAVVAWTGAGLLGMHKVAEPTLGWNLWTTFAVVLPIILFYVLLSGYIGVVISDFFQTLVIIAASLVLLWVVLADFGGPAGLRDALVSSFGPDVVSWQPPRSHELLGVLGVVAWTVGTAVGYGGDAAPMSGAMEGQRILSSRDGREAAKMYVWTQVILFFMLLTITLPALGAMVRWPGLRDGTINRELAYGMLLAEYLPAGLLGLAVSGILASIMSTVSSNMNFGAQVFLNDVYRRSLVPAASDRHYLIVGPARRDGDRRSRNDRRLDRRERDRHRRVHARVVVGRADRKLGAMVVVAFQRAGAACGVFRRTADLSLQPVRSLPLDHRCRRGDALRGRTGIDGGDLRPVGGRRADDAARARREAPRVLPARAADGRVGAHRQDGRRRAGRLEAGRPRLWYRSDRRRHGRRRYHRACRWPIVARWGAAAVAAGNQPSWLASSSGRISFRSCASLNASDLRQP